MNSPSQTKSRHLRPGEYLFRENETANALYIIKSGTIAIRKRRGNTYVELARAFSGEVLGELAFFDRKPRSAAAMATMETEVLELSFKSLDEIYSSIPPYMKKIMAAMAERLRRGNDLIRKLNPETVNERGEIASPDDEPDMASLLAETADLLDGSASLGTTDDTE